MKAESPTNQSGRWRIFNSHADSLVLVDLSDQSDPFTKNGRGFNLGFKNNSMSFEWIHRNWGRMVMISILLLEDTHHVNLGIGLGFTVYFPF